MKIIFGISFKIIFIVVFIIENKGFEIVYGRLGRRILILDLCVCIRNFKNDIKKVIL